MALSISLMFARFGGVVGSNTAALLLESNCESTFYLSGSVLIGKYQFVLKKKSLEYYVYLILNNMNNFVMNCSHGCVGILYSEYTQESKSF